MLELRRSVEAGRRGPRGEKFRQVGVDGEIFASDRFIGLYFRPTSGLGIFFFKVH